MKITATLLITCLSALMIMLSSCSTGTEKSTGHGGMKSQSQDSSAAPSSGNFGETVTPGEATDISDLQKLFTTSDTVSAKIAGHIISSCRHSGCWMNLEMGEGKTMHVTFADEAFTIPLDAAGKQAVITGKAIREMIPVETLKNYARDDGKSESEIVAITEPEYVYEFVADGVLIR